MPAFVSTLSVSLNVVVLHSVPDATHNASADNTQDEDLWRALLDLKVLDSFRPLSRALVVASHVCVQGCLEIWRPENSFKHKMSKNDIFDQAFSLGLTS